MCKFETIDNPELLSIDVEKTNQVNGAIEGSVKYLMITQFI